MKTVNDKGLAWLKFSEFGEFAYFAELQLLLADVLDKFAKLYAAKFGFSKLYPYQTFAVYGTIDVQIFKGCKFCR